MRVLIACEESQTVCSAFRALGHEAWSCDLLECSGGRPEWHIQGDVRPVLMQSWDMVIAFPPCTDLACSGARWFPEKQADGRQQASIEFFLGFTRLHHVPAVAIENPVGIMSRHYRKPDQIVQPWQFGDPYTKTTCLWLRGLPKLMGSDVVDRGGRHVTKSGKSLPEWYNLPPGPDRARIRSKTFPGLAAAMAQQWTRNVAPCQLDMVYETA